MHNEDNGDPNGDKLSSDRYKLKPEPDFSNVCFINNTPGVVKWYQSLPGLNAGLLKHSIHTNVPADYTNNKKDPAHKEFLMWANVPL